MTLHFPTLATLWGADDTVLTDALQKRVRVLEPKQDIIREGEQPGTVNVILEGWAQRYKQLVDGRRQILSFVIAGDLCHSNFALGAMDHSLAAVTRVKIGAISRFEFKDIVDRSPQLAQALWRSELLTAAMQREWTISVGRRTAHERVAHLFCEIFVRLRAIGATEDNACEFPLRQLEIAEATGLTQVHVNRTIQDLRRDQLIELHHRRLVVLDLERLMSVALFNPAYLHLERPAAPGGHQQKAG
ncbi:MAG TPA: Crp/Fnr family transcriptional regulator [Novosphingobium sp.]|nr:Crp/Fnr family transcriptional regulator [Novosphingobium sp.]